MILSNLGLESTAFGFTAGFTGKALQEMLLEFGAKTDFIPLADGQTRINVKINCLLYTSSMRKRHAVSGSIWKPSGVSVRRVLP